jgi:hypothetical protein
MGHYSDQEESIWEEATKENIVRCEVIREHIAKIADHIDHLSKYGPTLGRIAADFMTSAESHYCILQHNYEMMLEAKRKD